MFEIKKIRKDFPILNQKIYNKPLIYLDNAATTQKPKSVINSITKAYEVFNSNIHRGNHYLSDLSTQKYEEARQKIKRYINADSSDEIIFTKGATDGLNLVATTYGELLTPNDEIIISAMEHHSNIVPWQNLQKSKGIKLRIIPITEDYQLNIQEFKKLLNEKTKLVSLVHCSNTLGTINNIKEIIKQLKHKNIPIIIDASQSIQHTKIDVQSLDCDFLVFSGHKIYAPTGIGVLYGKRHMLNKLSPYQFGGDMIDQVTFEKTTYADLPLKYEAGTTNYIGAYTLGKAIDYINSIGLENIISYENQLYAYALEKIKNIDEINLYVTSQTNKTSVISFNVKDTHHLDVGTLLDKYGIATRTGTHCTQPLMKILNTTGTVRISFAFYNTIEEIDYFAETLPKVIKILKA